MTLQNFLDKESYYQNENQHQDVRSIPHKINFGVRRNFNRNHNLTLDGDVNIKVDDSEQHLYAATYLSDSLVNSLNQVTELENELAGADVKSVYIAKR